MIDAGTYGAINWIDLTTPDIEGARAFYGELLGWTITGAETPMGDYFVGAIDGHEVAGMMEQSAEMQGIPPMWTTFVYVEDIDATVAGVKDAGGVVHEPPFSIPGDARVAVVADPTGAVFSLISGERPEGMYFLNEPGGLCWVEVLSRDVKAAEEFYRRVFDWNPVTEVTGGTAYTMFKLGGEDVAGMMQMPAEVPADAPSHWSVYFAVADCVAAETKVRELGGMVLRPTADIEMGRFAVVADPQGAMFNLMEFAQ